MEQDRLEVADFVRGFGKQFLASLQRVAASVTKVLRDIVDCRTAVLGGHLYKCSDCGKDEQSYNSCCNRHCPKCQGSKIAKWLEARRKELLPIPYFHVVFTLPHKFNPLVLKNKKVLYNILFRASWETLRAVTANPKHLGAEIGAFGILHTWSQTLLFHPHIHFVCTGGGISKDKDRWVPGRRSNFFVPVKVLEKLFRCKVIDYLRRAYFAGELKLSGLDELNNPNCFDLFLRQAQSTKWNVYCKAPIYGAEETFKYLSSYTHRIAISNKRLVSLQNGNVTFKYRDYADGKKQKLLTIPAVEFLHRFCLHIVPRNFYRIRHFGFLANANRTRNLNLARKLLGVLEQPASSQTENCQQTPAPDGCTADECQQLKCSHCGSTKLVLISEMDRPKKPLRTHYWDSS